MDGFSVEIVVVTSAAFHPYIDFRESADFCESAGKSRRTATPISRSVRFRKVRDAERIAHHLAKAFTNQVTVDWDAEEYHSTAVKSGLTGFNEAKEASMASIFPPLHPQPFPLYTEPLIIVDKENRILLWHLPGIMGPERQAEIWALGDLLNPMLQKHHPHSSGTWRSQSQYFLDPQDCSTLHPGCLNFSPAWFQQGHETINDTLEVCALLKDPLSVGRAWLEAMKDTSALVSAILRVIHPEMYRAGQESLKQAKEDPKISEGERSRAGTTRVRGEVEVQWWDSQCIFREADYTQGGEEQ
ncbi:hypothetical protein B0H21DRAFT_711269 [Amylocystis lapponica]|nr:hypothetical protein B0H21DRAFT_711269 [Amylocystis lapponica]